MKRRSLLAIACLSILAAPAAIAAAQGGDGWEIGPVIRGKNYSPGMPPAPRPTSGGFTFDFPAPDAAAGHVHYVTFRPGSLAGKSRMIVRYRIDAAPGTRFVPQEIPKLPAAISLYLQRRGDNWTGRGRYEDYRWYSPAASVRVIAPGVHEISVRLDDPDWISVKAKTSGSLPGAMQAAVDDADRVGLTFGALGDGRGHGVFATAPARFTLLSFRIV
ncbi:hypothetical protein [Sphingopyxis sp.]|jgi:hypothetical protein|uniref:hypothetical protein n=1 Tax=Sphingopyxis sp. TaxID=1908224 RepID=UPI002DEFA2C2|nr:hypothetical protein [Sphingopyxis sp.]